MKPRQGIDFLRLAESPELHALAWSLAFVSLASLSIWLTRLNSEIAVIWPANAVMCVALLRLKSAEQKRFVLFTGFLGNALAGWHFGHGAILAPGFAALNAFESWLAYRFIRRLGMSPSCEDIIGLFKVTLLSAIIVPLLPSTMAAGLLFSLEGVNYLSAFRTWFASDAVGLVIMLPAVYMLLDRFSDFAKAEFKWLVICFSILVFVSVAVFYQSSYALLFLPYPALMLVAFRLPEIYSILATILLSMIAFAFTAHDMGPTALMRDTSVADRVQFAQFFITVALFTVVPAASAVARIRKLMEDLSQHERLAVEAKEQAERLTKCKTEFLATMSHEIRSPLNSIIGYTQLVVEREGLDKRDARDLKIVCDAGRALLAVVNDILDYSSLEAGRLQLRHNQKDIGEIIASCVSMVRLGAARKGLSLTTDFEKSLVGTPIMIDEQRVRQVFLNLLSNAIKYTDRGKVHVKVSRVHKNGTDWLRATVSDTGRGISADYMNQIFTRFSQEQSGLNREFSGSGLGLAISKLLVEQMDGVIGVSSTEGVGSTFWFELPLDYIKVLPVSNSKHATQTGERSVRSVLVVDDLKLNRDLTARVLAKAGHRVDVVATGQGAIEMIQAHDYDIVLMDVQMPGMDGLVTTRKIREMGGRFATLPIVAMTASVLAAEVNACKEQGMNGHIGRPFEWRDLLNIVESKGEAA